MHAVGRVLERVSTKPELHKRQCVQQTRAPAMETEGGQFKPPNPKQKKLLILHLPVLPALFLREFPGCRVVRTPCSHCRGLESIPGTKIPQDAWCSQKKKKEITAVLL